MRYENKLLFNVGDLVILNHRWTDLHDTFAIVVETPSKFNWQQYVVYSLESGTYFKHVDEDEIDGVNNG